MATTTTSGVPEIAQRQGAPITNVGSGAGVLPNAPLTPRTSSSTGNIVLPALAGLAGGALLSNSGVMNAIKNAVTGGAPAGGAPAGGSAQSPSSMASGLYGAVQKFLMPAGSSQSDFNAKYGVTNGQPNVVVSGVDMSTGQVVGTVNTNIPSSVTSMTPSQGGLSLGQAASPQPTATSDTFYQDDAGNIYTASGDLYAVKSGNSYYVNSGADTWTNTNSGLSFSSSDLFGGSGSVDYINPDDYFADTGYDPSYDPYSDYSASDFTSYYTPTDYSGALSPWGQGSSTDTSYYTPIDTTWGPSWKEGGLATPMYADGGKVQADGVHMAGGGIMDTVMSYLTSGGVQGALAGALLSQLLSSSSSGGVNTGVDMSKVGVINPRTTNFGMGAPNYITHAAYKEPATTATPYQLYSDLGVSGYTPSISPLTMFGKNPLAKADGGSVSPYYTYGQVVNPADFLAGGGQPLNTNVPIETGVRQNLNVPILAGRKDYRQGSYVEGAGDGQSDDIPAMLADGEYVMDAEIVSALGNGSNKAGAKVLDKMRENIRKHKRSGSLNSIPPKAKSPLAYMKGAK